ncbi:COMM domain-containing protein 10 isoform X2 [Paramormyrops kingsleyae]|uniref:COMM domain containing 10 n=1 Tax=Paramormyrops kingsleyae TaxID=1676925 RepID=A0A3B3TEP3_9TELE|nr:COMM domain-containing protein 10 isoform X2 [Paramormyrops kingsleyae]
MAAIIKETQSIKEAVTYINAIDINKFTRLLSRIFQRVHLKEESLFSKEEEEKLQSALSLEKQALSLVLETVSFIIEQAVYHNVKPAFLMQQLENVHLQTDKAEAFSQAWASAGPDTIHMFRQKIFAPKKLDHVGWCLNLQMGQSTQAKQKAPCATLEFAVSSEDAEGPERVFVQFNHQELLEFYNKLEIIQAQLDSLT